jgi:hypothetical protein
MTNVRNQWDGDKPGADARTTRPQAADEIQEEIKKWQALAQADLHELRRLLVGGGATSNGADNRARYEATVDRFVAALRHLRTLRAEPSGLGRRR